MNPSLRVCLLRLLAPALLAAVLLSPGAARADNTALYVTLGTSIEAFNNGGGAGVTVISGLSGANGIAFDASNDLFFGNQTGYEIDEMAAGGMLSVVTTATGHAEQIAFSPGGTLYANDNVGIERINAGGTLTKVGNDDGAYGFSLAFDATGNIYAGATGATDVLKFPAAGGTGTRFATGVSSPSALAFDSAGNLYISNPGANTVVRVPAAGGAATLFASTGLNQPGGLAFDAAGNLYVANFGTDNNTGFIERFNAAGGNATVIASGLNNPEYLAFGPAVAPEPSTWATLALGGAGLLGMTLRRPRRGPVR